MSREDLKVLVASGECIVRGERKLPANTAGVRPLSIERPWGPFERRFVLPVGSKPESVIARYLEGVLELRVPTNRGGILQETKVDVV